MTTVKEFVRNSECGPNSFSSKPHQICITHEIWPSFTCLTCLLHIEACFRFALIGQNLTARTRGATAALEVEFKFLRRHCKLSLHFSLYCTPTLRELARRLAKTLFGECDLIPGICSRSLQKGYVRLVIRHFCNIHVRWFKWKGVNYSVVCLQEMSAQVR